MIIELMLIIVCEIIVLLGILIVYCADYTNSYIHCHCRTEPYKAEEEYSAEEFYWETCYNMLYESVKDKADDAICDSKGTVIGVLFDD